jgi:hypothetical protein
MNLVSNAIKFTRTGQVLAKCSLAPKNLRTSTGANDVELYFEVCQPPCKPFTDVFRSGDRHWHWIETWYDELYGKPQCDDLFQSPLLGYLNHSLKWTVQLLAILGELAWVL